MTLKCRGAAALFVALVLAVATGCGAKTATVKGVVKVDGKPIPNGNVSFRTATGLIVDAPIQSDGTYSAPNVPVGEAQVLVSAMDPKFEAKMSELAGRSEPDGKRPAAASSRSAVPPRRAATSKPSTPSSIASSTVTSLPA